MAVLSLRNAILYQMPYSALYLFSCYTCLILMVSASSVIVDSPVGEIKGAVVTHTDTGENYALFRNIPYAKPPVGQLRFAKPEPHPRLAGVFDATEDKPVLCPQPDAFLFGSKQGSEDCLILNILAKNNTPCAALKKVIVYIHGGAYLFGSSYGHNLTSFVISHDVIGVTINYRVGILGFLSTGNEVIPGNYGLWDQSLALKWVKDNIKAFGGDPDDITISGESAGGISVAYQSLSPVNKGIFSKALLQSGMATTVFGEANDIEKSTLAVAQSVGCWEGGLDGGRILNESESVSLMQCMREVDVSAFTVFSATNFAPTVDGDFVPRRAIYLLQDKSYLQSVGFFERSYLVSILNNEFAAVDTYFNMATQAIINTLSSETTENEKTLILSAFRSGQQQQYIQSRLNTKTPEPSLVDKIVDFYERRNVGVDSFLHLVTDLSFLLPSYDFMNAATMENSCKSWFLYFDHFPAFMRGKYRGSPHGLDLLYWHDYDVSGMERKLNVGMEGEMDQDDLRLKAMFQSIIAGFMKGGDPGSALKEKLCTEWPEYDPSTSYYLNFGLDPFVGSHLGRAKRDLWLETVPAWGTSQTRPNTPKAACPPKRNRKDSNRKAARPPKRNRKGSNRKATRQPKRNRNGSNRKRTDT